MEERLTETLMEMEALSLGVVLRLVVTINPPAVIRLVEAIVRPLVVLRPVEGFGSARLHLVLAIRTVVVYRCHLLVRASLVLAIRLEGSGIPLVVYQLALTSVVPVILVIHTAVHLIQTPNTHMVVGQILTEET